VLLRVGAYHERGNVDYLLSDTDVSVTDEDTRMVDRLRQTKFEDLRLQPPLQKVGRLEGKHIIKLHLRLV